MKEKKLEVCAFNIQSCIIAQKVGASRVELCDNPIEGGTTPSYGTIKAAREILSIDLYPIIRPRSGNYFYDKNEYEIIKNDIDICKSLNCNGISVGAQSKSGRIDKEWLKRIVDWAGPMQVTCNRAFDGTPDIYQALEDIIECGCQRVLTSGGEESAPKALSTLRKLVNQSNGRIVIMPGAGVKSQNLNFLLQETGASEFHASARSIQHNPMDYINNKITDYGNVYVSLESELREMIRIMEI